MAENHTSRDRELTYLERKQTRNPQTADQKNAQRSTLDSKKTSAPHKSIAADASDPYAARTKTAGSSSSRTSRSSGSGKAASAKNTAASNGQRQPQRIRQQQARALRRRRQTRIQLFLIFLLIILIICMIFFILKPDKVTGLFKRQSEQTGSVSGQNTVVVVNDSQDDNQNENTGSGSVQAETGSADNGVSQSIDTTADSTTAAAYTSQVSAEAATIEEAVAYADYLAAGYDYDGAIDYLRARDDADASEQIRSAIAGYEETKASCVAVDVTTVPHIFYHSLVNEPEIAFSASLLGQSQADGMNAWMTTVDEFDKITQSLYDNGYVYVRLRDLVVETTDADGTVHFSARTDLMLPPGKKAIVLSVDDLSYYHSYKAASYPDHLVLDENGLVKCHYIKSDGTESIGDYDVVPRLNTFLTEHPDGAYHGARGLIALTGYNGVFGYRTDQDYELQANLMSDQAAWLAEHPDYNRDEEIAQATIIADALKAEGWEFASHTWGHLSVTNRTADQLKEDNQKWMDNVANIVGTTDTIIFAHGNDIGDWMPYSSDNAKYQMYSEAGYHFYCNVDASVPYWVQINDNCVRQGRIDLDGYLLYQSSIGATTVVDDMFTASEIFDSRRPTPVVANGQG